VTYENGDKRKKGKEMGQAMGMLKKKGESVQYNPNLTWRSNRNVCIVVFWVMTLCGLVGGYQRFGGIYRILSLDSILF
jgi:hypothetical protein